MSEIKLEVVLVRVKLIVKYCNTLQEYRAISLNDYLDDFHKQLVVERLLQLMIEAATDINKYLLLQLHQISPATNFDSFTEVGKRGFITQDLAARLAQSVGMRNILVHQYKDIDSRIVFSSISKALEQYRLYAEQIKVSVESLEV